MTGNVRKEYAELFVENGFNRKVLTEIVKPYIKLTPESKIITLENFMKLTIAGKAVCLLLAKKILKDVEKIKEEKTHITELYSKIGIKRSSLEGQLYGSLKNIVVVESGNCWIPDYNIQKAKKFLGGGYVEVPKRRRSIESQGVQELISSGFFSNPKSRKEVGEELESRGLVCDIADVCYKLRNVFLGKELKRRKENRDGKQVWCYYNSGGV